MNESYIYQLIDLGKRLPDGKQVLRNIHLAFFHGAKIGVLGANGAGKSTLLRIMAGVDTDIEGEAFAAPDIRIGFLPQEPQLDETKDVRGNVEAGMKEASDLLRRFDEINEKLGEPMEPDAMDKLLEEQGELQSQIDAANAWDLDRTLDMAMEALRCPPGDAEVAHLSGGERRRVALARLVLESPDILLLDEPTNHLDAESVAWLEQHLARFEGTVVAVTHDRYFLDNVAGWILELDRGHGIPWKGNYSSWLDQKQKRLALEDKQKKARQRSLERELEWIRMSPRARQAKSKARVTAFEKLLEDTPEGRDGAAEILIPKPPRLGDEVVTADGLKKAYGDKLLFDDLSFRLPPGGIVGIIGANGAGKTTLFRIVTGQEEPDGGTLNIGETVKMAYVDQSRDALDGDATVFEEISGGAQELRFGQRTVNPRAYCAGFNFRGSDQQKKVGDLSGGERNRVHLAKLLKSGGNLLLLDEPTNDLDVDTLRALEEALLRFAGCAVVISHDRWFLDRIATHILAFEGNSETYWFEGNFQGYAESLKRRKGEDVDQPRRLKYRKLA